MALQRIGNQIVLAGVGQYLSDSEKVNKAIEKNNAALKKQSETAAKTALNNKAIEEQQKSFAKRVIDAFTAPFRMLGRIIGAAINFAKAAVLAPFKAMGMLITNVLKGVIVAFIANRLTDWIFGGKAPIPAKWKTHIGDALTNVFQKIGGKSGVKFWEAFQKFGAEFFQGKVGDLLGKSLGLVTGGPLGKATNRIVGSVFSGFGKFKDITQAIHQNKAWGDLMKNLAGGPMSAMKTAFGGLTKSIQPFTTAIAGLTTKLIPLAVGIGVVVAALMGFKAFLALGQRGAAFEGIIASFDILARQAQQVPASLLSNMRKAANGTIADLDLITNANLALAGATGETAKLVGEGLPKLLEIARAQSRSTGKDVTFLFNSLVEGVKKAQPELIDNTGLLVRIGEANEELAKSLGKSVEALTAQERQQAILNATLKAGESAVKQLQGAELTAAELQQKIAADRKNTLDTLALSIQPLYKAFLTIVQGVSGAIAAAMKVVAPFINIISKIVGLFITQTVRVQVELAKMVAKFGIIGAIGKELKYVGAIIYFVLDLVFKAVKLYYDGVFFVIGKFVEGISLIGNELIKIFPFLKGLQDGLFIGGAKAFGALAAGILQAANKYIFPAIISIATFIADFLMGESPPPMGPLSTIDKGGANVMMAWLSGVTGVSLEPVAQVASQVTTMLGDVANYSLAQVKARLAELDTAIQPFQDRLDLIQARLEAMSKPLETARDMIAKRLDKAVEVLTKGGGNAEEVRALDKQLELINQRLKMNDEELQQAQLQFDLAKAMQAEERVALAIRERMLGVSEAMSDAAGSAATEAGLGSGSGSDVVTPEGGLPALMGGLGAGDSILGTDAIKEALGELGGAFTEGFFDADGAAALAEAGGNLTKLSEQTARISQGVGGLANKITDPFKDIGGTIGGFFETAKGKFDEYFGEEGTITTLIDGFGTTMSDWFGEGGKIETFFTGDTSVFAKITTKFNETFGPDSPAALLFGEGGLFGAGGAIETGFAKLFGPADSEGTLLHQLTTFGTSIGEIFGSIFTNTDSPLQKVIMAVSSAGALIWGVFDALVNPNSTLSISAALSSLKEILKTSLVYPAVDAVEAMANGIIEAINKAIENVWNDMPGVVRSASEALGLNLGDFQITRIDIPYPEFHEGGVVRANLLKGEGVLNIPMMKTLSNLEHLLSMPTYVPPTVNSMAGGGEGTSIDRSVNIESINYHQTPRTGIRTIRELRALSARNGF
jgi:hypothetical protein